MLIYLAIASGFVFVLITVVALALRKIQSQQQDIRRMQEYLINVYDHSLVQLINNNQSQNVAAVKGLMDSISQNMVNLTALNESKFEALRLNIEDKLFRIQSDNANKLEIIRATVEEKLHDTLENKLANSFKQVSEHLEQVYKGLGEMQNLASNVGDLKKIFTNVKTRGIWGEAQLETLLDQVLTKDQYIKNAQVQKNSSERVEFAIKIPSKTDDDFVLLSIDSKLPLEPFENLLNAINAGAVEEVSVCQKALEVAVKSQAKDIAKKYIQPPTTVDFAILFIPIEGLYAEIIKIPGLIDSIQRELRVMVTCPSTFAALLSSLQMGFRAIAIEKRSAEVWKMLNLFKKEFGRFTMHLAKTKQRIDQASQEIQGVEMRSMKIEKQLANVHIDTQESVEEVDPVTDPNKLVA